MIPEQILVQVQNLRQRILAAEKQTAEGTPVPPENVVSSEEIAACIQEWRSARGKAAEKPTPKTRSKTPSLAKEIADPSFDIASLFASPPKK